MFHYSAEIACCLYQLIVFTTHLVLMLYSLFRYESVRIFAIFLIFADVKIAQKEKKTFL